jgi:hypothetical protein
LPLPPPEVGAVEDAEVGDGEARAAAAATRLSSTLSPRMSLPGIKGIGLSTLSPRLTPQDIDATGRALAELDSALSALQLAVKPKPKRRRRRLHAALSVSLKRGLGVEGSTMESQEGAEGADAAPAGSTMMEGPTFMGAAATGGGGDSVASGQQAEKQAVQHDSPAGEAPPGSPRRRVSALSMGGVTLQSPQTPTLPSAGAGNTKLAGFRWNLATPPDSGAPPPLTPPRPPSAGGPPGPSGPASSVVSRSPATSGYLSHLPSPGQSTFLPDEHTSQFPLTATVQSVDSDMGPIPASSALFEAATGVVTPGASGLSHPAAVGSSLLQNHLDGLSAMLPLPADSCDVSRNNSLHNSPHMAAGLLTTTLSLPDALVPYSPSVVRAHRAQTDAVRDPMHAAHASRESASAACSDQAQPFRGRFWQGNPLGLLPPSSTTR